LRKRRRSKGRTIPVALRTDRGTTIEKTRVPMGKTGQRTLLGTGDGKGGGEKPNKHGGEKERKKFLPGRETCVRLRSKVQ